jgi:hypothetical protein
VNYKLKNSKPQSVNETENVNRYIGVREFHDDIYDDDMNFVSKGIPHFYLLADLGVDKKKSSTY